MDGMHGLIVVLCYKVNDGDYDDEDEDEDVDGDCSNNDGDVLEYCCFC